MSKLVIALILVATLLIGGLFKLLRNARVPMGTHEQLARAKERNRALEEEEARERAENER